MLFTMRISHPSIESSSGNLWPKFCSLVQFPGLSTPHELLREGGKGDDALGGDGAFDSCGMMGSGEVRGKLGLDSVEYGVGL